MVPDNVFKNASRSVIVEEKTKIAELKNVDYKTVAEITTQNVKKLFQI